MQQLVLFIFVLLVPSIIKCDQFDESLTLVPLIDGKLVSEFKFVTTTDQHEHFHMFPRALAHVIQKFDVREMHLSFTQGRWRYEKWGAPITPAPVGAELFAYFHRSSNVTDNWKGLVHALSGLLCGSLNFLDTTTQSTYASGVVSGLGSDDTFRYGTLSHETVCTENLTPFKKLMPSRSKCGLGTLLNPLRLYDSQFHSMGVHFRTLDDGSYEMIQTITVVSDLLAGKQNRVYTDFDLHQIFDRSGTVVKCPFATQTKIIVDTSRIANVVFYDDIVGILKPQDLVVKNGQLHVIDLPNSLPVDIKFVYNKKVTVPAEYPCQIPVVATRHESSTPLNAYLTVHVQNTLNSSVTIHYYDVMPWYFRMYWHTLKYHGGKVKYITRRMARERERPAELEMGVMLGPKENFTLSFNFDKVFLTYTEHSPDANRGFDLSSSIISYTLSKNDNATTIPLHYPPHNMQRIYTDSLLISLPTPDFSMPYNVITLSSTILALFFGSMFNALIRRFKDDDRPRPGLIMRVISMFKKKRD